MHLQKGSEDHLSELRFRSRRETCSLFGSALREILKDRNSTESAGLRSSDRQDKDETAHISCLCGYIGMTGIARTLMCSHWRRLAY